MPKIKVPANAVPRVDPATVAAALGAEPTPTPGSPEAVQAGCLCAVMDNCRGRGWMGVPGTWWITGTCPLHGADAQTTGKWSCNTR